MVASQRLFTCLLIVISFPTAILHAEPPQQTGNSPMIQAEPTARRTANSIGVREVLAQERTLQCIRVAVGEGNLLLPVEIKGKTYQFALSTGRTCSIYDISLRRFLGEVSGKKKVDSATHDLSVEMFRSPVGKVGKLPLPTDGQVMCLDLSHFRAVTGQDCYGFLSMDFLRNHIFRIDFDRGEISFLHSIGLDPGQRVPIIFDGEFPCVMIEAQGMRGRGRFVVDTVQHGTIGSGTLYVDNFAIFQQFGFLTLTGYTNQEIPVGLRAGRIGRVTSISLAGFRHDNLLFTEAMNNVLSLNYLSRYVVTFDFSKHAMYLKEGCQFARRDLPDMSGMTILKSKGQIVVQSVDVGRPADRAGVRHGDVLLQIGDLKTSDMSLNSIRRLLCAEGKKCRLLIRRGEAEQEKVILLQGVEVEER